MVSAETARAQTHGQAQPSRTGALLFFGLALARGAAFLTLVFGGLNGTVVSLLRGVLPGPSSPMRRRFVLARASLGGQIIIKSRHALAAAVVGRRGGLALLEPLLRTAWNVCIVSTASAQAAHRQQKLARRASCSIWSLQRDRAIAHARLGARSRLLARSRLFNRAALVV